MNFFSKIKSMFKKKGFISSDDFGDYAETRRTFATDWTNASYFHAYGKSIYVYACVSRIAEKVASIDFVLKKIINEKGDAEIIKDHEILDLLYKVNPFYTKTEFLETDLINRKLTGDSFILKIRNEAGQVAELWNVRPDLVQIVSDPENYISHYEIFGINGKRVRIEKNDMIHIRYPSPLSTYLGMSPLSAAKIRVDTEEYATTYQRDFFLNNARPDAIIEFEGHLTEDQKRQIIETWEKRHQGRNKSSKLGLLWGGAKYSQISLNQREMDFINSLKFTRDDILVAFKVPKSIVGITEEVNYANAKTAQEIFINETVIPEVKRLIEKLNEELVIPEYGEEYYLDFVEPVVHNREARLNEFVQGVDKWLTANEIRREIGLKPLKNGDYLYRPLAVQPIGGPFSETEESQNYKILHGRRKLKIKFEMRKTAKEIKNIIKKTVKKGKISDNSLLKDPDKRKQYHSFINKSIDKKSNLIKRRMNNFGKEQMEEFMKKFEKENPKTKSEIRKLFNIKEQNKKLKELMLPLVVSIAKEAGQDALDILSIGRNFEVKKIKKDVSLLSLLAKRAEFFAASVNNTTLAGLVDTLAEGIAEGEGIPKLAKRIREEYDDISRYRSELIARTETNAVVNEATLEAYKQAEVVEGKEWVATLDDRVRDEHLMMDGEVVGLNEPFSNGEMYPNECNCRCVISPITRMI